MSEHVLLPLMLAEPVMHVHKRQVDLPFRPGREGLVTLEKLHLNTLIPWENYQVRRRFWVPDWDGERTVRRWGWATMSRNCRIASLPPGWYWLFVQGKPDDQGGLYLYAFDETEVMPITPAV